MIGIPVALETDSEDVAWALQTADVLWKRSERVDAIVWLRRAAQAAGDADDPERALTLARAAAELADGIAQSPPEVHVEIGAPESLPPSLPPPVREPSRAPVPDRVPSAAEAHAGMLDPWAEAATNKREAPPAPRVVAPPPPPPPPPRASFDADEVVTSAPAVPRARPPSPPPPPVVPPPPPLPRAVRSAAPVPAPAAAPAPAPFADEPAPQWPRTPSKRPSSIPKRGVDLSHVEALSDLPDDAREALADAATVQELGRDEEVSGFALALVVDGATDLAATIVDSSALKLEAGAILRARGTIDQATPLRLIAQSERATVATWDERAVDQAFRTCPWVEDELRAAGDRLQALVGATMGPLGDRLDPTLRAEVTSRLAVRALAEHEVFAQRGAVIPGLLVVGAGELELVGEDGEPCGAVLRAGDFLFPNEVLGAAPAPATVRASRGGALILLAERKLAQELLVTCPPLLEIFAGV